MTKCANLDEITAMMAIPHQYPTERRPAYAGEVVTTAAPGIVRGRDWVRLSIIDTDIQRWMYLMPRRLERPPTGSPRGIWRRRCDTMLALHGHSTIVALGQGVHHA